MGPPLNLQSALIHLQTSKNLPKLTTAQEPRRTRSRESSRHHCSEKSSPRTPSSPEPSSAVIHGEPRQPGNIQDYLESRLETATKFDDLDAGSLSLVGSRPTKNDYKAIFSGAPHFVLERGKHGRFYPQVIFPWDPHNPSIQRLLDRKLLPHGSFTMCTLHAHLPIPDDWAVKGGVPILLENWRWTGRTKRATFDIGVFEVPNMLATNGREPGTVGFRHFLECPMADAVRYKGAEKPRQAPGIQQLSSLPATEAFELMDTYNKPYSQCLSGAVFDRRQLIRDGPAAWKRIGVRDIDLRVLVERMKYLGEFRQQVLDDGSAMTILDVETPRELHTLLHGQFLYPRPPPADVLPGHPGSLKSQIKTLAIVLATPGAWVDFSIPEWRVRAGQILWEVSPHEEGDPLNECDTGSSNQQVNSGMERKWLLVQLLLAAELILRLDAFVRKGMLHDPHGGLMTAQEIHDFDKLREGKVNWDLIVVRRFFNNLKVTCGSSPGPSPVDAQQASLASKPPKKGGRFSLFESINRRTSNNVHASVSAWDCLITSPRIHQQLEGLFVFAENIGWPRVDKLQHVLAEKLKENPDLRLPALEQSQPKDSSDKASQGPTAKDGLYTKRQSSRYLRLRSTNTQDNDPHASDPLGWISRSLLSGFVIPGDGISHLLMGTILENDPDAIEQLGPTANLYGGFIYKDRSWWSKACIIGRVISALEGSKTCMGWVGSNSVPRVATRSQCVEPGWFEVQTKDLPSSTDRRPRIRHGGKLALESSPLGVGEITTQSFTLPMDPEASKTQPSVRLDALTLDVENVSRRCITSCNEASMSFAIQDPEAKNAVTNVRFPLSYNVRFVSAHECRPPRGFTPLSHEHPISGNQPESPNAHDWTDLQRLTGHPLHKSFPYRFVSSTSLSPNDDAPATSSSAHVSPETLVIDARGCRGKETMARAWCASVGTHSVIGRVGKTCVGCCIREARAIGVPVVIRVGEC